MARCAIFFERAFVRVSMAGRACGERDASVFRGLSCFRDFVALGAGNLDVFSRQEITRVRVVEPGYVLPVRRVVARCAVFLELTLVKILMTGQACGRHTKKAAVQVFLFDDLLEFRLDECRIVALLALDGRMFAFQFVASFVVIEFFLRGVPADEFEFFSVVF